MKTILISPEQLDELYADGVTDCVDESVDINEPIIVNTEHGSSGLAIRRGDRLEKIVKMKCSGLECRNAEQTAAMHMLCREDIPLITVIGKAGSGKTLLALAAAMQQQTDKRYRKILIARPIVGLGDRDEIGFLPGDVNQKLEIWFGAFWDNLSVLQADRQRISKMMQEHQIEMVPLQTIRGRTLHDVFVIVDEAQNIDCADMKSISTRIGNNCKIVFTGDTDQIDRQRLRPDAHGTHDGLSYLIQKMSNQPLCGHIRLKKSERSALCELLSDLL